jgi:thioredoxin 1
MPLIPMKSQELFETMWFHTSPEPLEHMREGDCAWIQYHTATWCGACKRLDLEAIVKAAEERGLTIWKIDVDENEYTSGYCGVRSMPTLQFCRPRHIVATLLQSDTQKVLDWIHSLPEASLKN